jgi:hypothetical protein
MAPLSRFASPVGGGSGFYVRRKVKTPATFGAMLFVLVSATAAEPLSTNDSEAAQWQRIAERMRVEMGISNFLQMTNMPLMRAVIVHPSFGIYWDEIPPPTLTNSSAMAAVDAFIATNGWNMHTGVLGPFAFVKNQKTIQGLPWREIQDREFPAVTHNGILYVILKGWHFNDSGIAFNPKTNNFPESILGFKPLENHWYVWAQRDDALTLTQVYEGQKNGEHGQGKGR